MLPLETSSDVKQSIRRIKITDFGLSRILTANDEVNDPCGTPAYIAPEMLQKFVPYNKRIDIWALGILMYQMVAGTLPFQHTDKIKQSMQSMRVSKFKIASCSDDEEDPLFEAIKNQEPNYELQCFTKVSEHCTSLIKRLLVKDPDERISIKDALCHEFFTQFDP